MAEEDSRPESSGVGRTLALGVAVILAASVCFLAAFFITADRLDDGATAGAPSQVAPRSGVAPADDEAGNDASDRAVPISPGALAGAPEPSPGAPAAATAAGELFTTRVMPDFDPDTLIHGGPGEQGAILAGPGIVRSSGADRRTDWELIVPSAQIRASIAKVGVTPRNLLGAPDNPEIIGWWEDGPAPARTATSSWTATATTATSSRTSASASAGCSLRPAPATSSSFATSATAGPTSTR